MGAGDGVIVTGGDVSVGVGVGVEGEVVGAVVGGSV